MQFNRQQRAVQLGYRPVKSLQGLTRGSRHSSAAVCFLGGPVGGSDTPCRRGNASHFNHTGPFVPPINHPLTCLLC